tara:strand:- start:55117 stop:55530 length:414 start_codon:yes stop_codon:yes gene_type:complete
MDTNTEEKESLAISYNGAIGFFDSLGKSTKENIAYAYDSDKNTLRRLAQVAIGSKTLQVVGLTGTAGSAAFATNSLVNAWQEPDAEISKQEMPATSVALTALFGAVVIFYGKNSKNIVNTVDQKVQESLSNKAQLNM